MLKNFLDKKQPVAYLADLGILGEKVIAAHGYNFLLMKISRFLKRMM